MLNIPTRPEGGSSGRAKQMYSQLKSIENGKISRARWLWLMMDRNLNVILILVKLVGSFVYKQVPGKDR